MAPTILIIGATGNTGQGVVNTLSSILSAGNTSFSNHRVLALTRSSSSAEAKKLAALPNVEVAEYDWTVITPHWLHENNVVRAFVAPYIQPEFFAQETAFHQCALRAGVEYVVRISTTAPNVRPDSPAYYARSHWAIEAVLDSAEFEGLKWTSLQPNAFVPTYFYTAVEYVREFRRTGKRGGALSLMASEDARVAVVEPREVGVLAAHLLTQEDVTPHNKARYIVDGPEDITGRDIVAMVEQEVGAKIEDVVFKDMSLVEYAAAQAAGSKSLIMSSKHALESAWDGKCAASTMSPEVVRLAAPKVTPAEAFKALLEG